jgi:hypothetical protein
MQKQSLGKTSDFPRRKRARRLVVVQHLQEAEEGADVFAGG